MENKELEYLSIKIKDGDEVDKLEVSIDGTHTLIDGSDVDITTNAIFSHIETGLVDERLVFDKQAKGEVVITISNPEDGTDEIDLDIRFSPKADFHAGTATGAQALALTALTTLQGEEDNDLTLEVE